MSEGQIAPILVSLVVLLTLAHGLGFVATRLRQPRFVGEILAGVALGPFVLGRIAPELTRDLLGDPAQAGDPTRLVLGFLSWLGLLLLMFVSGSEVRRVLAREQRRPTAWILGLGTAVPFAIAFGVGALLPRDLRGPQGGDLAFLLVLSTAAAVTSIPVISRIFHDLRILHTRFASLVLGTAMLEDVALFAALAIATALARPGGGALGSGLAWHVAVTAAYFALGLLLAPRALRRILDWRWNVLARRRTRVAYALVLMLAYTAVAAVLEVNVVFGAFLAGFGLVGGIGGTERERFAAPLDAVSRFAFASFIPLYFALVGARLELGAGFSLAVLIAFLAGSSALRLGFVGLAAGRAGLPTRDAVDVAVAMNARGGPGIVLATVAFEAAIIAPQLFTALVITAIVTSQAAGWWLGLALRDRGELLGEPIIRRPSVLRAQAPSSAASEGFRR